MQMLQAGMTGACLTVGCNDTCKPAIPWESAAAPHFPKHQGHASNIGSYANYSRLHVDDTTTAFWLRKHS